ncbi:Eco57I restriction-modification methylase domain-containing protein [Herpetosiphon geysericola]|uniref:Eco57I restriction-modification methylase domain-containing protein n=1 Tax=Herpetosiphon geysericola TaxID=70996 RepID=UPI0006C90CD9|nr:TaqI-like C-terminal specificity domain-containing protein [Herpetosiphon geysericola]
MTDSSAKKYVVEAKQRIAAALAAFGKHDLAGDAATLLASLGYQSQRRVAISPPTKASFEQLFLQNQSTPFNEAKALWQDWLAVDVVFQLTDSEIRANAQLGMFDSGQVFDKAIIESYLVLVVRLKQAAYSRSQLADATRSINQAFAMPVLVLFEYGGLLTISIIQRRLNLRDQSRDTLGKVTLIKDILLAAPHRAHLEILYDLSLDAIVRASVVRNFVELNKAWQRVLDSEALNQRFFREISDWYFWAVKQVKFPEDTLYEIELDHENPNQQDDRRDKLHSMAVIRLLTRLIFVWFLRERGLVSAKLFERTTIDRLLVGSDPSRYYKAVLQNLFFATLNQEMDKREFRKEKQHFNITSLYRYQHLLADPNQLIALLADVPFLNGGLFECLDKKNDQGNVERVDGFSDRADNPLYVPDHLFWAEPQAADLNQAYGTKNKRYSVRGLIDILSSYKFTIAENTPIEEEVALDPELLGKVFENLLAAYNPETGDTARKQTGSFYTPRNVVQYMVDQALIGYFQQELGANPASEAYLQRLLSDEQANTAFEQTPEAARLIGAIDRLAILDPACGSGAFPMGVLSRLVNLLGKLDPRNEKWKQRQQAKARQIDDPDVRDQALNDIQDAFERNDLDYGRKLYLIEHGIYGVDIQPIAVQIAKLRCYIALLVDQRIDDSRPNRGVRLLPNLETRFVAANSLLDVANEQIGLRSERISELEQELEEVRRRHFSAKTPKTKQKYRDDDKILRLAMREQLQRDGVGADTAATLAGWDPYNQNNVAGFFNPEWMFGRDQGFDVVLGNPPYVRQEKFKRHKPRLQQLYTSYVGTADLYVYFFERAVQLLKPGGFLCYIVSNKYFRAGYGAKLRQLLASQTSMQQLLDFGDADIFTAIAYPSIIITQKAKPSVEHSFKALNWEIKTPLSEFERVLQHETFSMPQTNLASEGWRLEQADNVALLNKLRAAGTPLGKLPNHTIYYGIKTGLNEAFVIDRVTKERLIAEDPASASIIKPFLRGRDVKRWNVNFAEQYLIKIPSSENMKHPWSGLELAKAEATFAKTYPAIFAFMQPMRADLIKRSDQGKYYWELRSCAYWQEFEQPKIIYPNIAKRNDFAWDETGFYTNQKAFIIPNASKYLLAILNSSVVMWLYTQLLAKLQNEFYEPSSIFMKTFPIPKAELAVQALIQCLVEYVLYLSQWLGANQQASAQEHYMLAYFEQLINGIVYELYLPEVMHAANIEFINPLLTSDLSYTDMNIEIVRTKYQQLYALEHPVRRSLQVLHTLPEVKMIDGRD